MTAESVPVTWPQNVTEFIRFTVDSFTIFDAEHANRMFVLWTAALLIFITIVRPPLIKLFRKLLPYGREPLPDSLLPKSSFRKALNLFHVVWTLVMMAALPAITRRSGSPYLCYWAFAAQAFFGLITIVPHYRRIRRFALTYLIWPVHATMVMANFGYVFYGFMTDAWDYHMVHFFPPLMLWLYVLTHIYEYDDAVNLITKGFLSMYWLLISGLVITTIYQNYVQPVEVYEDEMRYMFLFASIGISIVELITGLIFTAAHGMWLHYFASAAVKQFYRTNAKTKKM